MLPNILTIPPDIPEHADSPALPYNVILPPDMFFARPYPTSPMILKCLESQLLPTLSKYLVELIISI